MERLDPDRLDARDASLVRALLPALRVFNRRYLRLRADGLEHVPETPALFVGNHNGGIAGPDLSCTLATLWEARGPEAPVYALAHDFAMRIVTPVGRCLQRVGAVRACPENVRRIIDAGGQALVYPGGDLEAYRHARHRDTIVLGRRTGFVRVAQETGVPLVPVVVQGAHRSAYIFHDGERLAEAMRLQRWIRVRRFPLALALPWGVALGPWVPYMPLPFPLRLRVLPPIFVAASDDVREVQETVRQRMQKTLDDLSREARA